MTRAILRGAAWTIAVLGVIDPGVQVERRRPAPVRFEIVESAGLNLPTGSGTRREQAEAVERRLVENLRGTIDVSDERVPAAVVLIGDTTPPTPPSEDVPISTVSLAANPSPNVRIVRVEDPRPAALRQAAVVHAEFEAIGMSGQSSVITLEDDGIVGARVEHRWTKDHERFQAELRYAPPSAGIHRVTVGAVALGGEAAATDNTADVSVLVDDRPLRVLAFEPRPSWNATFVRRALEADRRFEVAALVRPSRGVVVRTGGAPSTLTAASLDTFDVIIVGAPEDLGIQELNDLAAFAHRRGGGVVFLPDRRPSGPYADVLPAGGFDEMLVENPVRLAAGPSNDMRASELLVARRVSATAGTFAAIVRSNETAPVSLTWTHGAGRLILWGALDAWRFRTEGDGAFARFWQGAIADLALGAPDRIAVTISPRVAAANERVVVRAALRQTEFAGEGDRIVMPAIGATLRDTRGGDQPVRLWPTSEVGVFEGQAAASEPGTYDVQVTAADTTGRASFVVATAPRRVVVDDDEGLKMIADSTGGVAVRADDLTPLEDHLRALGGQSERATVRPLRSPWWILPFAACLCGEWALRRRKGLA